MRGSQVCEDPGRARSDVPAQGGGGPEFAQRVDDGGGSVRVGELQASRRLCRRSCGRTGTRDCRAEIDHI